MKDSISDEHYRGYTVELALMMWLRHRSLWMEQKKHYDESVEELETGREQLASILQQTDMLIDDRTMLANVDTDPGSGHRPGIARGTGNDLQESHGTVRRRGLLPACTPCFRLTEPVRAP